MSPLSFNLTGAETSLSLASAPLLDVKVHRRQRWFHRADVDLSRLCVCVYVRAEMQTMHRRRWLHSEKNHILFPEVGQKRHFTTATSVFFAASCLHPQFKKASSLLGRRPATEDAHELLGVKGVFRSNRFDEVLIGSRHSEEKAGSYFWELNSLWDFADNSRRRSFNLSLPLHAWLMTTVTQKVKMKTLMMRDRTFSSADRSVAEFKHSSEHN